MKRAELGTSAPPLSTKKPQRQTDEQTAVRRGQPSERTGQELRLERGTGHLVDPEHRFMLIDPASKLAEHKVATAAHDCAGPVPRIHGHDIPHRGRQGVPDCWPVGRVPSVLPRAESQR